MKGLNLGRCGLRLSSVPRCAGFFFVESPAFLATSSSAVQLGTEKGQSAEEANYFSAEAGVWGSVRVSSAATGHVAAKKGVTYVQ
jgi:hypothetical protein